MRIVHDLAQAHPASRSHVTIGVFDGVHRGHQQLITKMADAAHATGSTAVALTFDPHPATVLSHAPPSPLLTTPEERAQLLAALGLDILVVVPFTLATSRILALDFVTALMEHLRIAQLWTGPDFALGYRREGNLPFLRRLGAERGFTVRVVEPMVWQGAVVSSSRVRAALRGGDIQEANGCLGRPYRLSGVVTPPRLPPGREIEGAGEGGRSSGTHTATISPPPKRLIPASGVYACLMHAEHLGTCSTVITIAHPPALDEAADRPSLVVEADLEGCDADLFERVVALDFIARLGDE